MARTAGRADGLCRGGRAPTDLVARSPAGAAIGFLKPERRTPVAAGIHVMGVTRNQRDNGFGRSLLAGAGEHLRGTGVRWLTLHTLAASHPDPHYVETRRCCERSGFDPLEEFATLLGRGHAVPFSAQAPGVTTGPYIPTG